MGSRINQAIRHKIGGDAQKIISVKTGYEDIIFKHVLLPIWLSACFSVLAMLIGIFGILNNLVISFERRRFLP